MEKALNLSPSRIETLPEGKYPDAFVPGLCVIVSHSGKKTWQFRRRVAGSATIVTLRLGGFPTHSIGMAREWGGKLNEAIERGVDPREAERIEKARSMSLADAHAIYMAAMHRGDRKTLKPRTLYDKHAIYRRDVEPRLGKKMLSELTEDECWNAVYDKAKVSKVRANKMAGELSCFLRWCSSREGQMDGIGLKTHPAPTLNSNWFATGAKANKRFLSADEIKWLFHALVAEELVYRRGTLLLLLTAARRNELFGAPASEVVEGLWTLPPERSKNGLPNYIALGPWGRRLAQTNHKWLFPSLRIDGPQLYGWFKARDRIHARMEDIAGMEIARWHFHDLRRTFRSHARKVGIDRDIAELMLNHKKKGLDFIYDQNEELDLRREGFAAWEGFLVSLAVEAGVAIPLGAASS
jgi:integrase